MRMRLKSKWREKGRARSLEDNAVALAANLWRIAVTCASNLHEKAFEYDSDEQRVGVIREYLAFLVHVSDRLAAGIMDDEARRRFVTALATGVARHVQENQSEVLGAGDHGAQFIGQLNHRSTDYAEMEFAEDGSSYASLRYLAGEIQELMGDSQVNRWVTEQVVEIDGPEAVDGLRQAMDSLFGTSVSPMPAGFDPED